MTINPFFSRLWQVVRPYKKRFAYAILGMIGTAATEPALPWVLKLLMDNGFSEEKTLPIWVIPLFIIGAFFLRGVTTFCTQYFMSWIANKIMSDLRDSMFKRTLEVPIAYYLYESSGRIINTIMSEVGQVVEMIKASITTLVRDSITVVVLIIVLLWQNWQLTVLTFFIIPGVAYIIRYASRRLRHLNSHQQQLNSELTQVVEEATRAHQVIRVFGAQKHEHNRFKAKSEKLRGYAQRVVIVTGSSTPVTQLLAACAAALVIVVAMRPSLLPFAAQQFTPGDFAYYLSAMLMLLKPLKSLSDLNGPLQRGLIAAETVFKLIDSPIEPLEGIQIQGRAQGKLEFINTQFSYQNHEQLALKGINLEVNAGQTVALVGMSGGGKTSLVNLVPRFYNPTSGCIKLDGVDLQDIAINSLRAQIAMVGQNVVLFDDTVAANIAYGDDNPDPKRIDAAVQAAHLNDVVAELPLGLQTHIGDNGMRLSGGQRQRLAIARAIYKNAPILILDEATSALDSESERAVQAALDNLIEGRTTLVIAHRLSTIERADKIVVLVNGEISEMGTHAELLQKNGTYAHLYQLQFQE